MSGIQPDNGVGPGDSRNTITNPRLASGCENLWYGPRCNPRMDPFAMNALIAEIINAVNCADLAYDCDRLDNLCRAIRKIFDDKIVDCIENDFPIAGQACEIEQLVLIREASGCQRIARYTAAGSALGGGGTCQVLAPGTSTQAPPTPGDPNTYYTPSALTIDARNGNIDMSRLINNHIARMTVNIPCDNTLVEFRYSGATNFDPQANGGAGAISRVIMAVDGDFIPTVNQALVTVGDFTNFQNGLTTTRDFTLDAGVHVIDFYVIAASSLPPATMPRNCTASAAGSVSVAASVSFRR